jgi:hypothetical protein
MKVLADLHHADLYYSLQLLFEKRLGAELYRPIGMEWYHEGFWNVFPHPDTAGQFLGLNQAIDIPKDVHGNPLPRGARVNEEYRFEDGIYYVTDVTKGKIQRAITLDKFRSMEFDLLVSSIPAHIEPFNKLISQSQPRAKHIFQVGNVWGCQPGVKNILASTAPFSVPDGVRVCFYHQEFDLDVWRYTPPTNHTKVYSWIHWMQRKDLMNQYAASLPGWEFRSFGAGLEDHIMETDKQAERMLESGWTWHYKPEGDGYGYAPHRACATGRPLIVWGDFYKGKLAGQLMQDGVTCVDISRRSFSDSAHMIRRLSHAEEHLKMAEAAHRRFCDVVSFEEEEQRIRRFLEQLV